VEFPFSPDNLPSKLEGRQAIFEYLRYYPTIIDIHEIDSVTVYETSRPGTVVAEWRRERVRDPQRNKYDMTYATFVTVRGRSDHQLSRVLETRSPSARRSKVCRSPRSTNVRRTLSERRRLTMGEPSSRRVAVVTGGAGQSAAAIVQRLARDHNVVIVGHEGDFQVDLAEPNEGPAHCDSCAGSPRSCGRLRPRGLRWLPSGRSKISISTRGGRSKQ